jgi:hypothetical protein
MKRAKAALLPLVVVAACADFEPQVGPLENATDASTRVRTGRLSKVGMQAEHQEPNAPLANANIVLRAPRSSGRFSNSHTDALEDRPRENKPRRTLRSVCGTKSGALRTAAKRRMCSSPTSTTTA